VNINTFNDAEFQTLIESILNDSVNEGLIDKFKKQIDFIKGIAIKAQLSFKSVLGMFKNRDIVKFFKSIEWSLKKLFDIVKEGFKAYRKVSDAIFGYAADNKIVKWTDSKLHQLDEFLQTHPKLKRLGGLAVGGILVFIWLNMSFTGDYKYDFNFDDVVEAVLGNFSLATIFSGQEELKLLTLFATGMLFGLSFPWVGHTAIQFVGGLLTALNDKFKVVSLEKVKKSFIREAIETVRIGQLKKMVKEKPMFIFIMGGTGSGKNYIFNKNIGGIKLVDIDKYIEEYAIEYNTDGRKQISRAVARSKRELLDSFRKKESVAQVGTGLNNKSSENKFKWAKEAGLEVVILFVDTDVKTAMKRNRARADKGDQALVPDHKVERSVSQSRDNFKLYSKNPDVDYALKVKN